MMDNEHAVPASSRDEEGGAAVAAADNSLGQNHRGPSADNDGMEALLRENDYAFRSLRRGETVEGTIVRVDQDEILVDVGLKSEGVIPSRELYSEPDEEVELNVGDRVLVYVLQPEGSEGHAILSLRRARMERSWRDIEELYNQGAIIEGPVVDHNKGGLIVDVKGVRGFVPVSQVLDLRNVGRQEGENEEVGQTLAAMQGRRLPLKIIEINRSRNRLILSERAAVQERRTQKKDELLESLQPGNIRHGVVSNLTSFGAFIDLGGADGLVHVSELSYNRVNHPSEVLQVGQEVDVMVLNVDRETKKIALSLKRALPDPWTTVDEKYRVGQVVPAVITKITKFGAFAKVQEGLEGLVHLSELTDLPAQDAAQFVHEGQEVNVKIIHIASQRRRLGLSVRQAGPLEPAFQSFGEHEEISPFAEQDYPEYEPAAENPVSPEEQSALDAYLARQRAAVLGEEEPETAEAAESLPGSTSEDAAAKAEPTSDTAPTEAVPSAGEPDQPAAEIEPTALQPNGPAAAAEVEVSSTSTTESLSVDEQEERPEVATANTRRSNAE
jgi:small subunit ribosomal protein S1